MRLEANPDPDEPGGNSTPQRDAVGSLVRDLGRGTRSAMPRHRKMIKIISGYSTKLIKCGIISYTIGKQFTNLPRITWNGFGGKETTCLM